MTEDNNHNNNSNNFQVKEIIKRDGRIVPFDVNKIADAIFKAAQTVGGDDKVLALTLAKDIEKVIAEKYQLSRPTVENVQDIVEKTLIERGHAKTAKSYILHRHTRGETRAQRALILGEQHAEEEN